MRPSNDDHGDYRARAAACRAKAERAAEHQHEARIWLETAAMWDGLADRLEERSAAVPPRVAGPEADLAATHADETEAEPPPLWERVPQPAAASRVGRPQAASQARRFQAAALTGFLLLLGILAFAVPWPRTDERANAVAERSESAGAAAQPHAAVTDAVQRPAAERGVPPTEAAPIAAAPSLEKSAAVQPSPDLAVAPPESPRLRAGADTTDTGQGPAPDPQSAVPEPSEAGPPHPQLAQPVPETPEASPLESRPDTALQREKLAGIWWPNACPKPDERKNAVPMILGDDRARAGAASCTFLKKTQAGNGWSIVAKCSDGGSSWTAHIRLVLAGKRLSWTSERGTQTYLRCFL
jgi:hypothetical protein